MAKILLVEDDNNLREIYEARLQAEGYQIVSANDGESALVVAKSEKPDLIISDVMMPKISGFEMLDILRNTEGLKDVKVIMLTALGQADDQARANQLGADKYLVKSQVTLEDIVKVSHDLLDGGSSEAAAAPDAPADDKPAEETPAAPAEPAQSIPVAAAPADDAAASDTQSSAQEESDVEKQIQNFVENQPADAPPAASPADDAATTEAADDKVLSNAVDNLVADTESEKSAAATETAPVTPPADDAAPTGDIEHNSVGSRKVIKPLDSEPKPDLDALLAMEEARETTSAPAEPVVGGEDAPSGSPTPPPSTHAETVKEKDDDKPVDPNSIAL